MKFLNLFPNFNYILFKYPASIHFLWCGDTKKPKCFIRLEIGLRPKSKSRVRKTSSIRSMTSQTFSSSLLQENCFSLSHLNLKFKKLPQYSWAHFLRFYECRRFRTHKLKRPPESEGDLTNIPKTPNLSQFWLFMLENEKILTSWGISILLTLRNRSIIMQRASLFIFNCAKLRALFPDDSNSHK